MTSKSMRLSVVATCVVACALAWKNESAPRAAAPQSLIGEYCVSCHSEKNKAGGLSLAGFDSAGATQQPALAENVVRKLRAGLMPPAGAPKPDAATRAAFVAALENKLDAANPEPGWRPFQRLTRSEYAQSVRDLTGVEIDAGAYLPPDTLSNGFDNIADVQTFSPTLISGYLRAAGQISRTALSAQESRRKIFICRQQETRCATQIIRRLTAQAYRGAATVADVQDALNFYARGRREGDFDNGIRLALQSILTSPRFLFRLEKTPVSTQSYRLGAQELATRLSFFLWGAGPDAQLIQAARSGALQTPAEMAQQVRRMLADARAETLSKRFAGQWLRLQDLERHVPDARLFPGYDKALAQEMRRETELFFDSFVRADRNILELFTAEFSFVNERLAAHYGLPDIKGAAFRRVTMPDERRGLLGQGSILVSTSLADRTSPVLRGKWIMEVLFGTPPPPPPPNVPALDDTARVRQGDKTFSTRQRMEQHRRNPACNSCHRVIDPPGLALENFDATGAWRAQDNGVAIDATTELYDGTKLTGLAGLRQAILDHQDIVLLNFTENLLTYALGRRVEASDMPTVRFIVRAAAQNKYRFSSFVLGVAGSAAFQMAKAPTTPVSSP